ncbi:MAG TPA: hypothetical protein V6C98_02390 [Thermosynechococcaceae cyanobacterium]
MARRRKKPDQDAALNELDKLLQEPPKTEVSPLEIFVTTNYLKLIEAIRQGHSLTQIGAVLRRQGISSTPKLLRQAVHQAATKNNVLDQLPEKLRLKAEDVQDSEPASNMPVSNRNVSVTQPLPSSNNSIQAAY